MFIKFQNVFLHKLNGYIIRQVIIYMKILISYSFYVWLRKRKVGKEKYQGRYDESCFQKYFRAQPMHKSSCPRGDVKSLWQF